MGRFITLPGVNPPTDRPLINTLDPILPTAGALLLLEPAHRVQPWAAGVPANGIALPNLALDQARAMFPALTDAQLSASLTRANFTAPAFAERSAKGGLHLSRGREASSPQQRAAALVLTDTLRAALAGSSHHWFISLWARVTQAYSADWSTGVPQHMRLGGSYEMGGFFTRRAAGETNYPTDARRLGQRAIGASNTATTIGPLLQNVAISSIGSGWAVGQNDVFQIGDRSVEWGRSASMIFYRAYIEDLTVSGRTYAQVDALDNSMFQAAVATSGGKYHGDTFTAPAL